MITKHTAGPWNVMRAQNGKLWVTAPDGDDDPWYVAQICESVDSLSDGNDDQEANARLIAQAPLMYDSLTELAAILRLTDDDGNKLAQMEPIIRAALEAGVVTLS